MRYGWHGEVSGPKVRFCTTDPARRRSAPAHCAHSRAALGLPRVLAFNTQVKGRFAKFHLTLAGCARQLFFQRTSCVYFRPARLAFFALMKFGSWQQ